MSGGGSSSATPNVDDIYPPGPLDGSNTATSSLPTLSQEQLLALLANLPPGWQTQVPGASTNTSGTQNQPQSQTSFQGGQTPRSGGQHQMQTQTPQPRGQTHNTGPPNESLARTQPLGDWTGATDLTNTNTAPESSKVRGVRKGKRKQNKDKEVAPRKRVKDVGLMSEIDTNVYIGDAPTTKGRKDITKHEFFQEKMTVYWARARSAQRLYAMIYIGDPDAKRDRTCAVVTEKLMEPHKSFAYDEAIDKWDNNFQQWRLHTLKKAKDVVMYLNRQDENFKKFRHQEVIEQWFYTRWESPGGIEEFQQVFYWFKGFDIRASTPKAQKWVCGVYVQVMTMAKLWDYNTNVKHRACLPKRYAYDDEELRGYWEEIAEDWDEDDRPKQEDFAVLKPTKSMKKKAGGKRSFLANPDDKPRRNFVPPGMKRKGDTSGTRAGAGSQENAGENNEGIDDDIDHQLNQELNEEEAAELEG